MKLNIIFKKCCYRDLSPTNNLIRNQPYGNDPTLQMLLVDQLGKIGLGFTFGSHLDRSAILFLLKTMQCVMTNFPKVN